MSVYPVTVSGLPESATMGGVENLIYAKCSGRILAITLQGAGGAVIEFAEEADAQACAGEYEMAGAMRMAQIGSASARPPPAPPSSPKRSHAGPVLSGNAITNGRGASRRRAPVRSASRRSPEREPQSGASSSSSTPDASAALLHTPPTASTTPASGAVPPALVQMPSDVSHGGGGSRATAVAQAATEMATASGVFVAPEPNKTVVLNKNGKEKERRLNRVGLSYRCGHCGMPKKGHIVRPRPLAAAAAAAAVGRTEPLAPDAGPVLAPPKKKSKSANKTPPVASARARRSPTSSPTSQMYLDSDSIFNDIKSVLQQPAGGSGGSRGRRRRRQRRRRRRLGRRQGVVGRA